ncbi:MULTISPECIES: DnaJ domain-containing protein [unclassified Saccharothrix]|uniref:DnaJ domain-containing protein n=1 Tax=unclassified Saccharothrix TaxID=2593673 RepID=UPI00307E15A1
MTGPSLRDLDGHDPYALLGVPPTATRAEIVAAHRKQVQLVHPDRPGGSEYETKLLHVAKDVLLDPRCRAEFDASRAKPADAPRSAWDEEAPFDDPPEPPRTLWDSEEVVTGAGPPAWDEPPPARPHWDPPPSHWDQRPTPPHWDQPSPQWQPPHWEPPPWQPPARTASVSALPIVALVLSTLCWCAPLGLALAVTALRNPKRPNDRAIALAAVVIGSLSSLLLLWVLVSR